MNQDANKVALLLRVQLESRPLVNEVVTVQEINGPGLRLTTPLAENRRGRFLRRILPIRQEKTIELDALGAELFRLIDNQRTVEEMVDLHRERWRLTFFEARAMVLEFLKTMMARNIIVLLAPKPWEQDADGK